MRSLAGEQNLEEAFVKLIGAAAWAVRCEPDTHRLHKGCRESAIARIDEQSAMGPLIGPLLFLLLMRWSSGANWKAEQPRWWWSVPSALRS